MREIKFRAWDGHKMYADVGVLPLSGEEKVMASHHTMKYRPDQVELMQYTGLKDKNGVEIYESDICEVADFSNGAYVFKEQPTKLMCFEWDVNYARYKYSNANLFKYESSNYRVVGNIHENPELLK